MKNRIEELRGMRVAEDQRYVWTKRSDSLHARLTEFWEHAQDCLAGGGSRRRLLASIGESGSGKSTSLAQALNSFEEFRPRDNEFGEQVIPLITFEVPVTCKTKDLAIHILKKLNLPANRRSNEDDLYEMVKKQLKARGTIILHLDEAQHLKRSNSNAAVRGLQDRFKSLLVVPDWPLHLIVSGVPDLATLFTGDQQLSNRSHVMRFEKLRFPGDKVLIVEFITDIVEHCGLKLEASILTDNFMKRLVHATDGGAGTMIEMIRSASYKALSKGHAKLGPKDFQFVYGRFSGSLPSENIMSAASWAGNPPVFNGLVSRIHAAIFSFCAGVMPPMPILGRSLLYVHSHCVANSCASSMLSMMYWSSHSCRTVRL
jgi:hypothetical protein